MSIETFRLKYVLIWIVQIQVIFTHLKLWAALVISLILGV